MSSQALPWERNSEPRGVGVCLSGGGLRAASFSIGAVQALQEDRGLLFGKRCADHLAVVSGGSYLGAALMLNAKRLSSAGDASPPPLAAGTPEAEHVLSHGTYLKSIDALGRFALAGLVNVLAFVVLFGWTAVILAGVVEGARAASLASPADPLLQALLAFAFLLGARTVLRGLYLACGVWRILLPFVGAAAVFVTAPATMAAIQSVEALSRASWWTRDWRWALAVAVMALVLGASFALDRFWPRGWGTQAAAWVAARVPAAVGAVFFCVAATEVQRRFLRGTASDASPREFGIAAGILVGAIVAAVVMLRLGRTSLHGLYRDRLASCFSVARAGDAVEVVGPTEQKLSELAPPRRGQAGSFPRLLVCATANVVWDPDRPLRSRLFRLPWRHARRFASFIYSHDRCGIPRVPGASVATTDLEKLTTQKGVIGREPLVSLMTAVASTGAAISPAMGRRTSEVGRPVIALSNLRLGRWLPNPFSACIRADLEKPDADRRMRRRHGVGGAYDEFVPELFGLHQSDGFHVYVSDGGHYDNLGLLALLQARCKEIWCVDAQADATGEAGQLRTVIALAASELGVDIEIDLSVFGGPTRGVLGAAYTVGEVRYPQQPEPGRLVAMKLGLVAGLHAEELFAYAEVDRGFAHHGTFWPPWRVTWYRSERFEKYREVGYVSALAASQAVPAS